MPVCACDENICHELPICLEFLLVMTTSFISCLFVLPCFANDDKFPLCMTSDGEQLMILVLWGIGHLILTCHSPVPSLWTVLSLVSALMLQHHYQMMIKCFLRLPIISYLLVVCYVWHFYQYYIIVNILFPHLCSNTNINWWYYFFWGQQEFLTCCLYVLFNNTLYSFISLTIIVFSLDWTAN